MLLFIAKATGLEYFYRILRSTLCASTMYLYTSTHKHPKCKHEYALWSIITITTTDESCGTTA